LQNFTEFSDSAGDATPAVPGRGSAEHIQSDLRSCGWRLDTLWNEPQLLKRITFVNENLAYFYRFRLSDPLRRRLESAGAEGLRGNEA